MSTYAWDKSSPIEKSACVHDETPVFYNLDGLNVPQGSLTMLDLFCGAGGFSVGASWAGFFPVFGIDYLAPAIETWRLNHPNSACCLGDIRKVDAGFIREALRLRDVGEIDLLVGGVPCQGFSRANRKHTDDDSRNFLFIEYMRFVGEFLPAYIILENVGGLRSTAHGSFESRIVSEMQERDYEVTVKLVNTSDYGVPQIRRRLLFAGVLKGKNHPMPYKFPPGKFDALNTLRNVKNAISDLPPLGNDERKEAYESATQDEYQALMRGEGFLPVSKPAKLYNHAAPKHPQATIDRIAKTQPGKPMYPDFKQRIRLDNNAPSPTQLAGGIRPQFQFGHPTQPRGLSVRERARIQSFPDSYIFTGGLTQERVLTGNAVPPLMVYELVKPIAENLLRAKGTGLINSLTKQEKSCGIYDTARSLTLAGSVD